MQNKWPQADSVTVAESSQQATVKRPEALKGNKNIKNVLNVTGANLMMNIAFRE